MFLRTVKESDLSELYTYINSMHLTSEHQFRLSFYETGFWTEDKGTLLILHKDQLIGAIWFEKQLPSECLDLRFAIFLPEHRNQGYMTEGLKLAVRYLFATQKTQRLQISVPDYSKPILRLAQKCGFQFEGIARSALFQRGAYVDLCIYSLLRKEIEKIHS
jgi:RimJ/RimL family protein N-acetyltransferase